MFEHIRINSDISMGKICEALMFYNHVTIELNEQRINKLFSKVEPKTFVDFVGRYKDRIHIEYIDAAIGLRGFAVQKEFYMGVIYEDEVEDVPFMDYVSQHRILPGIDRISDESEDTVNKFIQLVKRRYMYNSDLIPEIFNGIDMNSFASFYKMYNPKVKMIDDLDIKIHKVDNNIYYIESNIPNNEKYRNNGMLPEHDIEDFFASYIRDLLEYRYSIDGNYDIKCTELANMILESKTENIWNEIKMNLQQPELFQKVICNSSRTINEAIDNNISLLGEFTEIYEKSIELRDWLHKEEMSSNIVDEYYRQVIDNSPFSNLPIKILRWGAFTTVGTIVGAMSLEGVAIATGLSAFDTFIIDKIFKGNRPSRLIKRDVRQLKEFLR